MRLAYPALLLVVACTTTSEVDEPTTTAGPTTTTTSSTGGGGAGAGGTGGDGGQGGATGGQGGVGTGGQGGSGGSGPGWPTCDSQPSTSTARTIPAIWTANPAMPSETWVSGAIVTGISRGACNPNQACQIFLQADATYADLATGAQHGIKMFVSAATSVHFVGVAVGDVVDALGHAWRYNLDGQNELLLQVNLQLPGCAKPTGTATPTPILGVTLDDLTVDAYENTHGPLFVQVATVTGNPDMPGETFGIWPTGNFPPSGPTVSLSPFFVPGAVFTGLQDGVTTDFTSVSGVFGLFVPPPSGPKFVEIYARAMTDVVSN